MRRILTILISIACLMAMSDTDTTIENRIEILKNITGTSFVSEPEVLWWQITDAAKVWTSDGEMSIMDFGQTHNVEFARIKMNDGTYLLSYVNPGDGVYGPFEVDMDDLVSGNAKTTGDGVFVYLPDNQVAMQFMIEIGNWDSDDNWTSEASSRSYSYQELIAHIMSDWDSASHVGSAIPWTPDAFVVPEPDSMMLILVGTMFLMLKRPKNVYFIYEHTRS